MFYLGGVGLALFLDLLLLAKQKKGLADWILGFWLFIMALHLLMITILGLKMYPRLWGIDLPLPLMHGPLLYLYTLALTGKRITPMQWIIHLALPLAFFLYLVPFISLPAAEKIFVYENHGIGYEPFLRIRSFCIPLSGIVYILLSLYTLRRHRKAIVDQFSSTDKVSLAWLQNLIIWLGVIWTLVLIGNDDWIFSATVIFIFLIGFFGIRQGLIFDTRYSEINQRSETEEIPEPELVHHSATENLKYLKSGLLPDASQAIHAQLSALMASEKFYRNNEFTLMDLAERLGVLPNHVSQVINEREGKNFYDYINNLRIQEFLQLVGTPESRKVTLFALAQQCGFNSKSSFNRYFKKITGQAPSEYMQRTMSTQN